MTTASKITLARVVMIPAFMTLLLLGYRYWAFGVFVLASLTDMVDGYVARHYNQVSDFGKFVDPLADKLLVVSCILVFTEWGRFPSWAAMIVLAREFAVTGLRLIAVENGRVIAAGWSGKIKTACTMTGLCLMLLFPGKVLDLAVMLVIVVTTLYSGAEYFVKNWDVLGLSGHAPRG